jgi:hypothetical protein
VGNKVSYLYQSHIVDYFFLGCDVM